MQHNYQELCIGQALPELKKIIHQDNINLYAKASLDFNPIHIDPEFAKNTPAGGTIAHGMLVLAYISQMMTDAFGINWLTGGKLNVRFKAPARPGDILNIKGEIKKLHYDTEKREVSSTVLCVNQNNEIVVSGEAIVRLNNLESNS